MIKRQRPIRRITFLPQIIFLILVFITSVCGTYVALKLFGNRAETNEIPEVITIEIIITATPAPASIQPLAPDSNLTGQVDLPSGLAGASAAAAVATVDAERIGAVDVILNSPTPESSDFFLSANCRYHTVVSGDTPFGVAERYGADPNLLLEVNNMTIQSALNLQIGDRLLVPLEGCNVGSQADSSSGSAGGGTSTGAAAAVPVEIEIAGVEGIGDITAEGILLSNKGNQLNVTGWTLSDATGTSYVFPELLLFPDVEITLYTRSGRSTGYALFWGRDESVWEEGEQLTLSDAEGQLRKTLLIPGAISLE